MRIACPKCHEVQEVDEKASACQKCRAVIRRCVDCSQYDVRMSLCRAVNRPVETATAWYPTFSSESAYCRNYAAAKPAA